MRRLIYLFVRSYQMFISPVLGPRCRYFPTCSDYMLDSIERFGLLRGAWLGLRRLGRCHPWHAGGFDPVPNRPDDRACCRGEHSSDSHYPDLPIPPSTIVK